jgi:hypothetical protein
MSYLSPTDEDVNDWFDAEPGDFLLLFNDDPVSPLPPAAATSSTDWMTEGDTVHRYVRVDALVTDALAPVTPLKVDHFAGQHSPAAPIDVLRSNSDGLAYGGLATAPRGGASLPLVPQTPPIARASSSSYPQTTTVPPLAIRVPSGSPSLSLPQHESQRSLPSASPAIAVSPFLVQAPLLPPGPYVSSIWTFTVNGSAHVVRSILLDVFGKAGVSVLESVPWQVR